MESLRQVLAAKPSIAYALLFGSRARGSAHGGSDLDVAVGLRPGTSFGPREVGALISDLERAASGPVDLVLLDEAPPAVAYRIFRDGITIVETDHAALVDRKTRAILAYLELRPLEELATRGVLAAAAHGR